MGKPIYYTEVSLEASSAGRGASMLADGWFIGSTHHPDDLQSELQINSKLRESLVRSLYKKKADAVLSRKNLKLKLTVNKWQAVGETND